MAEFGDPRLPPRFWEKVSVAAGSGCWRWDASCNSKGYGLFSVGEGKLWLAHRVSFTELRGAIPDGLQIDHLCRNRWCVNPAHLEAVTGSVNVRRGAIMEMNRERAHTRTHCRDGHELTVDNVRLVKDRKGNMSRQCRVCLKAADAMKRERQLRDPVRHAALLARRKRYYQEHKAGGVNP